MKKWTHKVVKTSRGMQGEWFRFPTATTGTEQECLAYAERFAAEQTAAGLVGPRILVIARKGGDVVKAFRVGA